MVNIINLKLIVLGQSRVGKTAFIKSFLGNTINESYNPTINIHISKKEHLLKNENTLKITVWDLGGHNQFHYINEAYFKGVDIAFLIFDLQRPEATLKNLKAKFLKKLSQNSKFFFHIFIGSKTDLIENKSKLFETLKTFLSEEDLMFFFTYKNGEKSINYYYFSVFEFLKKNELIAPEIFHSNIHNEFLEEIGKSESEIKEDLITFNTLDSFIKKIKKKSKSKKQQVYREPQVHYKLNMFHDKKKLIFKSYSQNLSKLKRSLNLILKSKNYNGKDTISRLTKSLIESTNNTSSCLDQITNIKIKTKV